MTPLSRLPSGLLDDDPLEDDPLDEPGVSVAVPPMPIPLPVMVTGRCTPMRAPLSLLVLSPVAALAATAPVRASPVPMAMPMTDRVRCVRMMVFLPGR